MKRRRTAQLRHRVATTRRISVSAPARRSRLLRRSGCEDWIGEGGFFNLRASIAILLCAAAACSLLSATLFGFFSPQASFKVSVRTLSFSQRIAYQRAIEEVYWRHRIWPKENLNPKPSLDEVMSQTQLESRVEDYLRKSQVLEDYWQRPLTVEQLQAEMDRMAQQTKQPGVLRELFAALGSDPFVIAECLVKPLLTDRFIANLSAQHKGGHFGWVRREELRTKSMTTMLEGVAYTLPNVSEGDPPCTDDTWTTTSTTNAPDARVFHTAIWTGSEMIVWGGYSYPNSLNTGGRYNPSTDTWTATSTINAPEARDFHTAVWTGSEMIVWGGTEEPGLLNTGGRYNPSTDTWTATSASGAPAARYYHAAVWSGSEMIIWGGFGISGPLIAGFRYNPGTDTWSAISSFFAPYPRYWHTAVWNGDEMIIWGGTDGDYLFNTGGKYSPASDSWTATSTTNAPSGRAEHTAVWTGSEMIVWGGSDNDFYLNTGGRYNPSTNSWTATSTINAPSARVGHTAVWIGSQMIVWGGQDGISPLNTGGRYNPGIDNWTDTSTTNAPSARSFHTAVWIGNEMIVWGGATNTGGRYCAQSGQTPTPTPTGTPSATPRPAPTARPRPTPARRP